MPVVNIRKVRVPMHQCVVRVTMRVRLRSVPRKIVPMPVVLVMPMRVLVRHDFVDVQVVVTLGEMQVHAGGHQRAGDGQLQRHWFMYHDERKYGTKEWRDGKIGTGTRSTQ